jgi:hypothetical protein
MWKKVALGLVAALAVFVVVVATRPSEFRIARSLTMHAPDTVVFALIDDFHAWQQWSPWEKRDPDMKKEFSGPASGAGAVYSWQGNDEVGSGRMTITGSDPSRQVDIELEFLKPWRTTSETHFTIVPKGDDVEVTWAMQGQSDFAGKAMGLFMDMDSLVGKDFEAGLVAMKQLAEQKAKELDAQKRQPDEALGKAQAEAKAKADAEAAALEDAKLPPP